MKVVYTDSAIAEFNKIADNSRREYGDLVAAKLEKRLRQTIAAISTAPKGGSCVVDRPGVYALALVQYPFKIYYRIGTEAAEIVHIHNTSQQSWEKSQKDF